MQRSQREVETFIVEFEAERLPKERWTHEAHLVAGFWYTWHLGEEAALETMRTRIRRHNESVGTSNTDTGGYHETITRLYIGAIGEHISDHRHESFEIALMSLLASPLRDSGWPLLHYSRERLFSVEARRRWIEPDKKMP